MRVDSPEAQHRTLGQSVRVWGMAGGLSGCVPKDPCSQGVMWGHALTPDVLGGVRAG